MLVTLAKDERDFIREMAEIRCTAKKKSKLVSQHSEMRVTEMGIAGEFAMAKALGCLFDPWTRRGGDGHKRDLWRGDLTLSIKTRHKHLPAHFLYPTGQVPRTFHDDFGVVGRWLEPYYVLDIVGYCTREDMNRYVTTIPVSGTRSGRVETRTGVAEHRFRPPDQLVARLAEVEDAEVHLAQTQGFVRYFRNGGGR